MLCEQSTLASVPLLIGETLENDYQIDPQPIFAAVGIDRDICTKPGARVSVVKMHKIWNRAVEVTGDPMFGLKVGRNARPSDFHVLGHAWLASASLLDAMQRLCRYGKILSTVIGDQRIGSEEYDRLFRCPIIYGADADRFFFTLGDLEEPLSGSIPEVADAIDRIAERFIASFDKSAVATEVRQMLIQMLPSGRVDQDTVAGRLYRSKSTLQRQLKCEGSSYREILEMTRRSLAEEYLKDGAYTQAQIAFMTGFADQSNFARAFRRWTGVSPGQFQKAA